MATIICESCVIAPCLPDNDFFIPAPPAPPPVPTTRVTVCNTPQTVECPEGKIGYAVTIPACTYSQTLIFQAGTSQATKDALIAQVQANLDATALAAAQHQISCHDIGPPPPGCLPPNHEVPGCGCIPDVQCVADWSVGWGAPVVTTTGSSSASCAPTLTPASAIFDIQTANPGGVGEPSAGGVKVTGDIPVLAPFGHNPSGLVTCKVQLTIQIVSLDDGDPLNFTAFEIKATRPLDGPVFDIAFQLDGSGSPTPGTTTYGPFFLDKSCVESPLHIVITQASFAVGPGAGVPASLHTIITLQMIP